MSSDRHFCDVVDIELQNVEEAATVVTFLANASDSGLFCNVGVGLATVSFSTASSHSANCDRTLLLTGFTYRVPAYWRYICRFQSNGNCGHGAGNTSDTNAFPRGLPHTRAPRSSRSSLRNAIARAPNMPMRVKGGEGDGRHP